jgi:hypothetical protein
MWQILLLGLQQLDPASPEAEEILRSSVFSGVNGPGPQVVAADLTVSCGGLNLDLTTAEMTFKVFESFLKHPNQRLSRADLVKSVYGISDLHAISFRRQESLKHSVVKLVSRARRAARAAFVSEELKFLEWFPYDTNTNLWRLVRVSDVVLDANQSLS